MTFAAPAGLPASLGNTLGDGSLLAYDPNDVRPGWIALVLVMALAVATFLLWRSMNTQMRKIQMPPRGSSPTDDVHGSDRPSSDGDGLPPETPRTNP